MDRSFWEIIVGGLLTATVLSALVVAAASCRNAHPSTLHDDTRFTLDGCDYIAFRNRDRYAFTHAGNCRNPIHTAVFPNWIVVRDTANTNTLMEE